MKKVGKLRAEAVCPICQNIYLLDAKDIYCVNDRDTFKCDTCNRQVYIQDNEQMFRYVHVFGK